MKKLIFLLYFFELILCADLFDYSEIVAIVKMRAVIEKETALITHEIVLAVRSLDKLYVIFFPNYFEQPLLCYIAYLLIVNHLTMLPNAQTQSCGNEPAISFTLQCIPASIIKI